MFRWDAGGHGMLAAGERQTERLQAATAWLTTNGKGPYHG